MKIRTIQALAHEVQEYQSHNKLDPELEMDHDFPAQQMQALEEVLAYSIQDDLKIEDINYKGQTFEDVVDKLFASIPSASPSFVLAIDMDGLTRKDATQSISHGFGPCKDCCSYLRDNPLFETSDVEYFMQNKEKIYLQMHGTQHLQLMKLGRYTSALRSFMLDHLDEAKQAESCDNPLEFKFSNDFTMQLTLYFCTVNLIRCRAAQIISQFNIPAAKIHDSCEKAEVFYDLLVDKTKEVYNHELNVFCSHFNLHKQILIQASLELNRMLNIRRSVYKLSSVLGDYPTALQHAESNIRTQLS